MLIQGLGFQRGFNFARTNLKSIQIFNSFHGYGLYNPIQRDPLAVF